MTLELLDMPHHVAIRRLYQEQMGFINDESVENDIAVNCSGLGQSHKGLGRTL